MRAAIVFLLLRVIREDCLPYKMLTEKPPARQIEQLFHLSMTHANRFSKDDMRSRPWYYLNNSNDLSSLTVEVLKASTSAVYSIGNVVWVEPRISLLLAQPLAGGQENGFTVAAPVIQQQQEFTVVMIEPASPSRSPLPPSSSPLSPLQSTPPSLRRRHCCLFRGSADPLPVSIVSSSRSSSTSALPDHDFSPLPWTMAQGFETGDAWQPGGTRPESVQLRAEGWERLDRPPSSSPNQEPDNQGLCPLDNVKLLYCPRSALAITLSRHRTTHCASQMA